MESRLESPSKTFAWASSTLAVNVGDRERIQPLSVRQALDLALDRELLMSELGAARLRAALNSRLPPIWPGEPPIQLELVRAGCSNCFAVTVPPRFHNRLHRFPFEDGFLVCPVPDCTGAPSLQAVLYRHEQAKGGITCILEHTCDAGHHWQSLFSDDSQVTAISVVRLKRINTLKTDQSRLW